MNVLIDTNVLIRLDQDPRLPRDDAQRIIKDRGNKIFVSAASPWEIEIKRRKKKLVMELSGREIMADLGFEDLPITAEDGELAGRLAWFNADPFDRVILAQAERRSLTLLTADRAMTAYTPVATVLTE